MYFGEFDCTVSATKSRGVGCMVKIENLEGFIYIFLFLHPIILSSFGLTKSGAGPYTDWHANT